MEPFEQFPFDTGQMVESKSNVKGYRGAWFRCEIKDIQLRKGEIWCSMQYLDFPDEKISSTKAYQSDPTGKKKKVLMLRPSYPTILHDSDVPASSGSTGSIVVINGEWKVDDLVDWWSDGCYWGAKITAIINEDFVQVELAKSPLGEGGSYEASKKDIRPFLDWSIEQLWIVPCSKLVYSNANRSPELESEKREHFFMLRQEPLKYYIIRGSPMLSGDKSHMKRKLWDLESTSMQGRNSDDDHTYPISAPLCSTQVGNCTNTRITAGKLQLDSFPTGFTQQQILGASPNFEEEHMDQKGDIMGRKDHQSSVLENAASGPPLLDSSCASTMTDTKCVASNICNGIPVTSYEDIDKLIHENEFLDVDDAKIGSSIMALEELVSQVVWLKGVLRLGLKGWSRERKKKSWIILEKAALSPQRKFAQELVHPGE